MVPMLSWPFTPMHTIRHFNVAPHLSKNGGTTTSPPPPHLPVYIINIRTTHMDSFGCSPSRRSPVEGGFDTQKCIGFSSSTHYQGRMEGRSTTTNHRVNEPCCPQAPYVRDRVRHRFVVSSPIISTCHHVIVGNLFKIVTELEYHSLQRHTHYAPEHYMAHTTSIILISARSYSELCSAIMSYS